jgi:hypothetical protein
MKKKELRKIAEEIVKCELIIQNSTDKLKVVAAMNRTMELATKVESLEDMETIDDMVQEIFSKIS